MTAAPRGVARATARERLLEHVDAWTGLAGCGCASCRSAGEANARTTRRLLAAVLREAAEAGADEAEKYGGWTTTKALREYVQAAILRSGRRSAERGGR